MLAVLAPAALGARAPAATIQDIVGQVSIDSYRDLLDNHLYTHAGDARGFDTVGNPRYPAAEHDAARDNILGEFAALGLSTTLDPFTFTSTSGKVYLNCNNVVAVKPGESRPNDIYILGAHYDSVQNPGADDNASGVAAILEAARVLSSYEFEATLVFIAFDAEEKDLYGSKHYLAESATMNICGMVSLDMIAYNPPGDHNKAYIYGRTASAPIKQALAAAVTAYSGSIAPDIGGDLPYSDHAPFEEKGFQACLLIEHAWGANGKYHQLTDSIDTAGYIDYAYATAMTRGAVGYAATAAGIVPEPATMLMLTLGMLALIARRASAKRGG
jgi:hypothetical protein